MTQATPEGLGALLNQLVDGISTLVSQHFQLARLELLEDVRRVGGWISRLALYLPFLIVGYALLSAGLSVFLARWLGLAGGLCAVGLVNMSAAALGMWQVISQMRKGNMFPGTVQELQRSASLLAPAKRGDS